MTPLQQYQEDTLKKFDEEWKEWSVPLGDVNGKIADWWLAKLEASLKCQLEMVVKMAGKKDLKWFEDNYFTAENAYPSYDKIKDRWVGVTAKETYNLALDSLTTPLLEEIKRT
jgi:hypothetical protein